MLFLRADQRRSRSSRLRSAPLIAGSADRAVTSPHGGAMEPGADAGRRARRRPAAGAASRIATRTAAGRDRLGVGPGRRRRRAPADWLAEHVPLLDQFLASNAGQLPHAVFGVSAQGADFEDGRWPRLPAMIRGIAPSSSARTGCAARSQTPIVWLINAARRWSTVDQLLFGYRDGHELIAASCRLSPAQLRTCSRTSTRLRARRRAQLVGIWIQSLARYLLARIWPAPELPRPGAVWAHALLLTGDPALRRAARPRAPACCDARPPTRATATASRWHGRPRRRSAPAPRRLADVLVAGGMRAAMGARGSSCGPSPSEADGVLLALLDAFPAELRRELSFRTRQRARGGGSPYRLQVAAALTGRSCGPEDLVIDARAPPLAA